MEIKPEKTPMHEKNADGHVKNGEKNLVNTPFHRHLGLSVGSQFIRAFPEAPAKIYFYLS